MALVPASEYRAKKKQERIKGITPTGALMPWYAREDGAHSAVFTHVSSLRTGALSAYRERVLRNMRLYAGTMAVNGTDQNMAGWRFRYNLVRSIVDTAAAVLVAAKTLPYAQTRGADWSLRRKAAVLNRTLQQQYSDIGVFNETQQVVIDALVAGLGVLKVYQDPTEDGATTGCERCLPLSIVWDPAEAANGRITQIFEVRLVHRDTLYEQLGYDVDAETGKRTLNEEKASLIRKANGPTMNDRKDFQLTRVGKANQCVVIEAWHLPSSATAGDGKHGIYVSNGTLFEEQWTVPRFPFAMLRGWAPNMLGLTGTSLVELVEPAQQRLEELADYTDACQNLGSTPRVIVDSMSGVEPAQINNLPMSVLKFKNGTTPPQFVQFDATPHDLENSFAQIREQVLNMIGLSPQQQGGLVSDGVTSAVGQKAREDIQSKRHVLNLRYIEQYYLDAALCIVDTNNAIAERSPAFSIDRAARGAWLESSKWAEVAPKSTEAKMAVLPVAQLVGSPSAQWDTVQSWIAAGWCSPSTGKLLMSQPDTEGQADEDTEDEQFSHWLCDKILDGERIEIDPVLDQDTFTMVAREQYLSAMRNGAPDEVLSEFNRVLSICRMNAQKAQAAVTAAQQPAVPQMPQQVPQVVPPALQAA